MDIGHWQILQNKHSENFELFSWTRLQSSVFYSVYWRFWFLQQNFGHRNSCIFSVAWILYFLHLIIFAAQMYLNVKFFSLLCLLYLIRNFNDSFALLRPTVTFDWIRSCRRTQANELRLCIRVDAHALFSIYLSLPLFVYNCLLYRVPCTYLVYSTYYYDYARKISQRLHLHTTHCILRVLYIYTRLFVGTNGI